MLLKGHCGTTSFQMFDHREGEIYYQSTLQRHMDTFQTHRVLAHLSNAHFTMM